MLTEEQIDCLLSELRSAGLVASVRRQNELEIIGGTEERNAGIFSTLKNGFTISHENGMWICRMPGEGQTDVEKGASDLSQAVGLVCKYYKSLPRNFFD